MPAERTRRIRRAPGWNCTSEIMRVGAVLQPEFLFTMVTWIKYCWLPSENLDRVISRVLTVTAHLAHSHHKVLIDLWKQVHIASEKRTALSPRRTPSRQGTKLQTSWRKYSSWIQDWSSWPENIPSEGLLFNLLQRTATLSVTNVSD